MIQYAANSTDSSSDHIVYIFHRTEEKQKKKKKEKEKKKDAIKTGFISYHRKYQNLCNIPNTILLYLVKKKVVYQVQLVQCKAMKVSEEFQPFQKL